MIVLNNRKNYDRFILRYKKYVLFKKKINLYPTFWCFNGLRKNKFQKCQLEKRSRLGRTNSVRHLVRRYSLIITRPVVVVAAAAAERGQTSTSQQHCV